MAILVDLTNKHDDFEGKRLDVTTSDNPFPLFASWMEEAVSSKQLEPNACTVSTVNSKGAPRNRIVYLKDVINEQFVFYTNYASRKGHDLAENPHMSMLFFWPGLMRQVRVDGVVSKVSESESDAYFASRPYESKLGAWASLQSERLESRELLEQRLEELRVQYPSDVPRPPHWGGYALTPTCIEFWQGQPSRLHDRISFEKEDGSWGIYRLNP